MIIRSQSFSPAWIFGVVFGLFTTSGVLAQAADRSAEPIKDAADAESSDGISSELKRRDELRDDLSSQSIFPTWYHNYREWTLGLREKIGLETTISYDAIAQGYASGERSFAAMSGDLTFSGRYLMFGRRIGAPVYLAFRARHRHAIGGVIPPSQVDDRADLIWGTVDGFSDAGFQLPDLYIAQTLFSERLTLRYGQMTISALLDGHGMQSSKQFFMNQAFSAHPAAAFPTYGAGFLARWKSSHHWDVTFAASNVQGTISDQDVDFNIGSDALFQALQLGFDYTGFGGNDARVQVIGWRSDELPDEFLPEGRGLSVTVEQFGSSEGASIFGRYAFSDGEATPVDQFFVLGAGQTVRSHDFWGAGLGVGRSSGERSQWQGVGEVFYRWQVTKELQLSADVQLIGGESLDERDSLRVVAGLRGGITF